MRRCRHSSSAHAVASTAATLFSSSPLTCKTRWSAVSTSKLLAPSPSLCSISRSFHTTRQFDADTAGAKAHGE